VLAALRARRVDGILLVAATTEGDLSHIQGTIEAGIPVVCLDRVIDMFPVDCLSVDNVAGARKGVEHLIARGHTRIGILTGPLTVQVARDRLEGYRQALADAGIPCDESLVRLGAFRAEVGYRASLDLLREARPTAVFSSNAMMTLGLMRAINELHLHCPEEVSIVMFDDPVFSQSVRPELTCIAQPAYELGFQGAETLIQRLKEPEGERVRVHLGTELRERQSTAPAMVYASAKG
jgi:LacI family transcriptional regulator